MSLVPAVATKEDELLYCQQGCRRVIRLTFSIRAYERDDTYLWLATASKSVEGVDKAYVFSRRAFEKDDTYVLLIRDSLSNSSSPEWNELPAGYER